MDWSAHELHSWLLLGLVGLLGPMASHVLRTRLQKLLFIAQLPSDFSAEYRKSSLRNWTPSRYVNKVASDSSDFNGWW